MDADDMFNLERHLLAIAIDPKIFQPLMRCISSNFFFQIRTTRKRLLSLNEDEENCALDCQKQQESSLCIHIGRRTK